MEKEIAATASIGPSEPGMRSTAPSASEGGLESLETYSLSAIHIPSHHADDKIGIGPFAPNPAKLLGPLYRAVRADKPIPDSWREPLAELVDMLMADRDALTSVRAVRVVIEMAAADRRMRCK